MIIDFHTHIFPPAVIQNRERYLQADPRFAALYSKPAARLATAEQLIDSMDRCGIDMSVVCGFNWSRQEVCSQANDYILESVSRHPGRLVGMATVQPEAGEAALRELERCIKAGARGIGEMHPDAASLDSSLDSLWTPIVELLTGRGLFCLFHASEPVGHPYPGKGNLTPEVLYPFIRRYPQLKIVLAHWGGGLPFYAFMPEVKKALRNTWFDTAASPFLYEPSIYKQAVDVLGAERILFGSDSPLMAPARPLGEINKLGLADDIKKLLLGGNAQRLLEMGDGRD